MLKEPKTKQFCLVRGKCLNTSSVFSLSSARAAYKNVFGYASVMLVPGLCPWKPSLESLHQPASKMEMLESCMFKEWKCFLRSKK